MMEAKIKEIGYLEKGTGKHQSNVVYSAGGVSPTVMAATGVKTWIMILDTDYVTNTHTASMQVNTKEQRLNSSSKSIEDNWL